MKKFNLIVADPPWEFSDKLKMAPVKRGAGSQYPELNFNEIKKLPVKYIADDNSVLALWVPSTHLRQGLDVLEAWGFTQKQTVIWVKVKKEPLIVLMKKLSKLIKLFKSEPGNEIYNSEYINSIISNINNSIVNTVSDFDISNVLNFGMGHMFRQTHEIVLIGTRGKLGDKVKNRSQRSVHFFTNFKHSSKPEILQNQLELIFPDFKNRLELFARRDRDGWCCVGNEAPKYLGEDIRDSLKNIMSDDDLLDFSKSEILNKEIDYDISQFIKNYVNKKVLSADAIKKVKKLLK